MAHRGRKPSGKPGGAHLDACNKAHGSGDFHGAKKSALAYVNAVHKHLTGAEKAELAESMGMVQPGRPMSVHEAPKPTPEQHPPPSRRAQLAKLAMTRRKPS